MDLEKPFLNQIVEKCNNCGETIKHVKKVQDVDVFFILLIILIVNVMGFYYLVDLTNKIETVLNIYSSL
jgi:uncharacterized protein (DUF983 family)